MITCRIIDYATGEVILNEWHYAHAKDITRADLDTHIGLLSLYYQQHPYAWRIQAWRDDDFDWACYFSLPNLDFLAAIMNK